MQWPERMGPRMGISLIRGIFQEGIWWAAVMREVVEARALPSVCWVMTFTRKRVPPEPIMLTAIPVRMMSVFRLKAKNPISRDTRTPQNRATTRPTAQEPLQ